MKYDRNKSFGYPVQRRMEPGESADVLDYQNAQIQVRFEPAALELEGEHIGCIRFECLVATSVRALKEAVEEGKAGYFLRVDCPETYFRRTVQMEGPAGRTFVPASELRGAVEVSAFIAATKRGSIISDQIHEDFETNEFRIEPGKVLAVYPPSTFYLEKEAFRAISTVVEWREDPKTPEKQFVIQLGSGAEDSVYVLARKDQIEIFKRAATQRGGQDVLINTVMMAAVMQMVQAIKEDKDGKWKATRWGRALLAKHNEWGEGTEPVVVAQKVLKSPLNRVKNQLLAS